MIDRIFMITFSIGCLLAMLVFAQQNTFRPTGQAHHMTAIKCASLDGNKARDTAAITIDTAPSTIFSRALIMALAC